MLSSVYAVCFCYVIDHIVIKFNVGAYFSYQNIDF